MSQFIIRVQLNGNPTYKDYENLHGAMKRRGFTRFVSDAAGKIYHLPHAEYCRLANLTKVQVRDEAQTASASVWSDFQILVTEGYCAWYALRSATPAEVAAA